MPISTSTRAAAFTVMKTAARLFICKTGTGKPAKWSRSFCTGTGKGKSSLSWPGEQVYDANSEIPRLHLFDGFMYRLQHTGMEDSIIRFSKFVYNPTDTEDTGYKRKSLSTSSLISADDPREVAEFQWRLSRPFATFILAMLAIPFSYTLPREGKSQNVFIAAIAFAIYYNLTGVAQSWVEQGVVDRFPGVWWLHAIMLMIVVWLLMPGISRKAVVKR